MEQIYHSASEEVQVILVGNKCDIQEGRVVDYNDGKRMADKFNIRFFETSAKDGSNVNEAFQALSMEINDKLKGDTYSTAQKMLAPSVMANKNNNIPLKLTKDDKREEGGDGTDGQPTGDGGKKCRC